jgi:hypothetical protein
MLVVSRRRLESIRISDDVVATALAIRGGRGIRLRRRHLAYQVPSTRRRSRHFKN